MGVVQRHGLNFPSAYKWGVVTMGHTRMRACPGTQAFSHLDPGSETRWIGPTGGELNVAINFADSAGERSTHLTALVTGDPLSGLVKRGFGAMGVDTSFAKVFAHKPRGPLYGIVFSPLGKGAESPEVAYHVAGEAAALLGPDDFDFKDIFFGGAVFAHSGGIFLTVGDKTPASVLKFYDEAGKCGINRSFDANFRAKLWADIGGKARAQEVCRQIAANVEILEGNRSDMADALGLEAPYTSEKGSDPVCPKPHMRMIEAAVEAFPNLRIVLTNLRHEYDANHHRWRVLAWINGNFYHSPTLELNNVLDRVGGGDATTSYLLLGLMKGMEPQDAVNLAFAAGALKTATVGDTLKVGYEKVLAFARKAGGAAGEISR